ncbi:AAA family ATPase [Bradyrhizobium archetypum]|uniref:AAA family ATPase n=1 Tax=Bradyrhizobium archetypum TaxID=2721160 RepID=A0A7Y4GZW4_9BRAD|nr:AAA family ATPase [Bradyrhizobium archetypum]NOJ44722.1 AAA family ATPase [Bradyrhizobium archetypum]
MIKLNSIRIEGFRGIPGRLDVDLSAPLTVVYAPNGVGKTSICDAAEWLLTNSIKRLEDSGADLSDFRCDFAAKDTPTRVSGSMDVYGQAIDVVRSTASCEWRRSGEDFSVVTNSDFFETLAPSAAEPNVHKTHANHSRQIWLRGTRFLSGDSLAALLDSDTEAMGSRERLFADLLGVGHLIETERQLEIYAKNINQYVKQQQALFDNRAAALQQRRTSQSAESREDEKVLLPSAFARVGEASSLLNLSYPGSATSELTVSDARRMIALVRGELARRKENWTEKRSAEVSLAADWPNRFALIDQQSSDQEKSRSIAKALEDIEAEVESVREQSEAAESEGAELGRSLSVDQATYDELRRATDTFAEPLSGYLAISSESSVPYRDALMLRRTAPSSEALRAVLQAGLSARADWPEMAREEEEMFALMKALEEHRRNAPSPAEMQSVEEARVAAASEAAVLRRTHDRLASPLAQLRHLSASIVDMLTHAEHCPVCAHNWGSAEALRRALNQARETESSEIVRLATELESAEATVRQLQERLQTFADNEKRVADLSARIESLGERRRAYFDRIGSLGLKRWPKMEEVLDHFCARVSFLLSIGPIVDLSSKASVGDLDDSLPIELYAVKVLSAVSLRRADAAAQLERSQLKLAELQLDLERHARSKAELESEQTALHRKIENTEFRIQSLRSAWYTLSPDRPWTDDVLAELANQLLADNSKLAEAEELLNQAERLAEAASNLNEITKLETELVPIEAERTRLTSYALAAEAAQQAYRNMRRAHVRRQMEDFVRVISALFTRMQSNEVYDRISEGDASSPLSWRAISEDYATNPDWRFSQGQRQDFALAIFLARARGLGGTFFLDEPLVHLDDLNRVALLDVFRAICLENNRNISMVLTTASRPTLRHFIEKFSLASTGGPDKRPLLRVVQLEGNPRAGVSVRY